VEELLEATPLAEKSAEALSPEESDSAELSQAEAHPALETEHPACLLGLL